MTKWHRCVHHSRLPPSPHPMDLRPGVLVWASPRRMPHATCYVPRCRHRVHVGHETPFRFHARGHAFAGRCLRPAGLRPMARGNLLGIGDHGGRKAVPGRRGRYRGEGRARRNPTACGGDQGYVRQDPGACGRRGGHGGQGRGRLGPAACGGGVGYARYDPAASGCRGGHQGKELGRTDPIACGSGMGIDRQHPGAGGCRGGCRGQGQGRLDPAACGGVEQARGGSGTCDRRGGHGGKEPGRLDPVACGCGMGCGRDDRRASGCRGEHRGDDQGRIDPSSLGGNSGYARYDPAASGCRG